MQSVPIIDGSPIVPVPNIAPKRNYLLIRLDPTPKTGLIHLAASVQVKKPYLRAHVIRTGPGLKDSNGKPSGCNCAVGEDVVLMPNPQVMIPVDGGEILKSMEVEKTRYFLVPDDQFIGGFFDEEE